MTIIVTDAVASSTVEDHGPPAKMQKICSDIEVFPIMDSTLTAVTVSLKDYHVIRLENKKTIGQILKLLPDIPDAFSHLKRVDKSGRVLLQPVDELISDDLRQRLMECAGNASSIEITSVPATKPITRTQFEWAKQHWSTSFHPNKELEDLLNSCYFDNSSLDYVANWCQRAHDIGCVVVQRGTELALGSQGRHLLEHPAMTMVRELAQKERQGMEYLATDCDVFLYKEPCAMCAMALVHSRAARVFFSAPTTNGVLSEGGWQLHLSHSINHHYKVFRVAMTSLSSNSPCACGK